MKSNYTFSFLKAEDLPEVHQTFLKAFANYLVPIQLTTEQFKAKVKREGIVPSFCVAAYAGAEMAGFILTGVGEWQGQPTAYNAGTGVVPAHRGNQLTTLLYQFLLPKLKEGSITQCLLEVIQENKPALEIYKTLGFKVTRAVDSYRATKESLILQATQPSDIRIAPGAKPDWHAYKAFCKFEPTWQNTTAAFQKYPDAKMVLEARNSANELVGFIAFFSINGAVLQFAVHPDYREQGIGTALLREAVKHLQGPALLFINIDTTATDFTAFLERRYFKKFLGQYEMLMPLTNL